MFARPISIIKLISMTVDFILVFAVMIFMNDKANFQKINR